MRYFLTGGTGFIGNRLARALLAQGNGIVALVRTPYRARDLKELGATVVQGDITDRDSMRKAMAGTDGVFHTAAMYKIGVRDRDAMMRANVDGTRNVLSLMRELKIPRGVYTSTVAVFSDTKGVVVDESRYFEGPHLTAYDHTKWIAHYEVARTMMHEGLPLVIVQPGLVYGPGDESAIAHMLTDFLRRRLPFAPAATAFCWAHVDDIVQGHIQAMERGRTGESYILAGPVHTLVDALGIAAQLSGRTPPPIRVSPAIMRGFAAIAAVLEIVVPLPGNYSSESLRVAAGTTYIASSEKAARELGFSARDLRSGLKGTLSDLAARIKQNQAIKQKRGAKR